MNAYRLYRIKKLEKLVDRTEYILYNVFAETGLSGNKLIQMIREAPMNWDDPSWLTVCGKNYEGCEEEGCEEEGCDKNIKKDIQQGVVESFHDFHSKHQHNGILDSDIWELVEKYACETVQKIANINASTEMTDYIYARYNLWLATRVEGELVKAARD